MKIPRLYCTHTGIHEDNGDGREGELGWGGRGGRKECGHGPVSYHPGGDPNPDEVRVVLSCDVSYAYVCVRARV